MASSECNEQEKIWIREQSELKSRLIVEDDMDWNLESVRLIGGVDISFPTDDNDHACPGFVVLSYGGEKHLEVVYEDFSIEHLSVPYITNFLAFREVPLLKAKIDKLEKEKPELMPQVIMVDGNGVHHKRGFGIASHLGVLTGLPTIGVAKNLLHIDGVSNNEEHKQQIKNELKNKGDRFPLTRKSGETTLMALRTSKPHGLTAACKPIYVSVGHRVGLETAVNLVSKCCEFRVPEPTRQADILSRQYLRNNYEEELGRCACQNAQC